MLVFKVETPCGHVTMSNWMQSFRTDMLLHIQDFSPENGGTVLLLNVGTHLQVHTASQLIRQLARDSWIADIVVHTSSRTHMFVITECRKLKV
jgi:hypothetical protein